ncbi:GerAB/ArcD/ProY family transporter [Phosphitispora sp. TUW77]|uniref:GerAB/ArcD/ProY family transporter n=1 Tax=Phosphitispora sp. TUW77 TaxID=3152361 RepID=UPI003AB5B2E7
MENNEKVSSTQMVFLFIITISVTDFLFIASLAATYAAQDAWISVGVGGTLLGLLAAFIYTRLGLCYPDKSLVEYAPKIIGKFGGKLIGLLYILFFAHLGAMKIRELAEYMIVLFFPETPKMIFSVIVVMLGAYATFNGIEVLCRVTQLLFPFLITAFVFVTLIFYPEGKAYNLLPIMENGVKPIVLGALYPGMLRMDIILILMFLPYINQPRETGRTLIITNILAGFLLTMSSIVNIAVLGPILAKNLVRFMEQLEPLVLIIFIAGYVIKVSAFYLATVLGTAQWVNLKNCRPLVTPIGILILVYSLILYENTSHMTAFYITSLIPYAYTFKLIIPTVLLIVVLIRKKAGQKY